MGKRRPYREELRRYDNALFLYALQQASRLFEPTPLDIAALEESADGGKRLEKARRVIEEATGEQIAPIKEKSYLFSALPRLYAAWAKKDLRSDIPCDTCRYAEDIIEPAEAELAKLPDTPDVLDIAARATENSEDAEFAAKIVSTCPNPEAFNSPRSFVCTSYAVGKELDVNVPEAAARTFRLLRAYRRALGKELLEAGERLPGL